jgi:hypothetical protein
MHETGASLGPLWIRVSAVMRGCSWFASWKSHFASRAAPVASRKLKSGSWSEQDYQPAAAVITTAYRGHVDSEINDQYHTLSGSLRF